MAGGEGEGTSGAVKSLRILAGLLLASVPCSAQEIGRQPTLSARVANLRGDAIETWFRTMLSSEFGKQPDVLEFYGDVGPTNGCAELSDINRRIAARDFREFREAFLKMLTEAFPPDFLSNVPDGYLAMYLGSREGRMTDKLRPFLQPRAVEMLAEAKRWAVSRGYAGKKLGYSRTGKPYWGKQPALVVLVCADPNHSDRLIGGWKEN